MQQLIFNIRSNIPSININKLEYELKMEGEGFVSAVWWSLATMNIIQIITARFFSF
jgi:hypothetical protein